MALPPFIEQHKSEILALAQKHGVSNIRVFGSMARGNYKPESDIDFLVDVVGKTTPWFPVGMIQDLESLLGRRVDVLTEKALHPLIRDEAIKSGITLC
ncbi:MAG: nucleotidyltransferase family protein [Magnetococcales bacterium]|nr:nucleotidyltransferase family protein [Magnetococcales bacterium]